MLAAAITGSAMSLTRISWAPLGATQVRSGCAPEIARARALSGSAEPSASSSEATSRATVRLPGPAGPVEQVRVRRTAARVERRREHGPRVGMSLQSSRARVPMLATYRVGARNHDPRTADHDRGPRRRRQDDAGGRPRGGAARARHRDSPAPRAGRRARAPSASASSSRTPRSSSARAPRRCCTRPPEPSSSRRQSDRCSAPARGCCSTASSTPRWPIRAAADGWGSRRSARSTISPPVGWFRTGRCCCRSIPRWEGRDRSARSGPLDRLEREDPEFHARIAAAYASWPAADPGRIRTLDASDPPERVLAAALDAVSDLL